MEDVKLLRDGLLTKVAIFCCFIVKFLISLARLTITVSVLSVLSVPT